ncbi:hypothetical protein RJ641_011771 [Dillenia turbinata]|uniref:Uncharacterized protein n=1 Tax=Dillenia turbinata TaxID=194707 RepID=A0AAN8V666_9MAGN
MERKYFGIFLVLLVLLASQGHASETTTARLSAELKASPEGNALERAAAAFVLNSITEWGNTSECSKKSSHSSKFRYKLSCDYFKVKKRTKSKSRIQWPHIRFTDAWRRATLSAKKNLASELGQ